MSRSLLLVPLLLAAGFALADDVPEANRVADAAERQAADDVPEADSEADGEEAGNVEEAAEGRAPTEEGAKVISGMSILGNQEAPKSLVIVPWKSSELGDSLGISTMLDDSKQPIDKEVFMRELNYYEIRSEARP